MIFNLEKKHYLTNKQNIEKALYIYANNEKLGYKVSLMYANMYLNIKYLNCKYSSEQMEKCREYYPTIIDNVSDYYSIV